MKKFSFYVIGALVLMVAILYLPKGNEVFNAAQNTNKLGEDLVAIGIPKNLVTPNYSGEIYSFEYNVKFAETSGVIYLEMDENSNFYYLGHSVSLTKYFDIIPKSLMFDQFSESDKNRHAGAHKDCMEECKSDYPKGERGGCKASCWVDTFVALVDAIMPG